MADIDELFGSDGDSDNNQRGNVALIFYNIGSRVSDYFKLPIFLVQNKLVLKSIP